MADLLGSEDGSFKFGVDIRLRHKQETAQPRSYATLPNLALANVASSGNETYYAGLYQNGVDIQPGLLQQLLGSGVINAVQDATGASDVVSAATQFLDAHEDVYAGYGEYLATWGKLGLVVGVRVEHTNDRSNAFAANTNQIGVDPVTGAAIKGTTLTPVTAKASYTNAFPSVQLKYEIQPDFIARAAFSSTIARPGFNQSNVSLSVDLGSGIVSQGNPNLKPATANNFDVSLEKYLPGAGIISVNLFYKDISNYIVSRELVGVPPPPGANFPGGTLVNVFTFANAKSSYARGVELNFDHKFTGLPAPFDGLGLTGNFTYVDSRFEIRPGEFSRLPSSSAYTWNAGVFYEKGPLAMRLSAYSTSADLFGIGGDKTSDVFNATRTSMDFGSSYAFRPHWVAYFNAKNLLNTPHAFYEGTPNRPIQREFYLQTYQFGFRFDY
jgi:TonB-dependent receptor